MALEILAFSGSLRAGSYNTLLVRAAQQLAPAGMTVELYAGLREVPPFDDDLDAAGTVPPVVQQLRGRVRRADALLIATPEYNYSIPGVLKNAIDWLSRPYGKDVLAGKPVAIMGAATTNFGTVRAQLALRQVFLWTGSVVVGKPEVMVFRAAERFNDTGELVDPGTADLVAGLLNSLAALAHGGHPAGVGASV